MWGWLAGLLGGLGGGGATGVATGGSGATGGLLSGLFGPNQIGKSGAKIGGGLMDYVPDDVMEWANDPKAKFGAMAKGAAGEPANLPEMTRPEMGGAAPTSIEDFRKLFSGRQRPDNRQLSRDPIVVGYLQGLLGDGQ
jgi:hypothetical protein